MNPSFKIVWMIGLIAWALAACGPEEARQAWDGAEALEVSGSAACTRTGHEDKIFMGDWNGDGVQTPGIRRNNVFLLRDTNTAGEWTRTVDYGLASDEPLVGDWNGDGIQTVGVKRGNTYYLRNSNTPGAADITFAFGSSTDTPLVGDWDGDGIQTVGVKRGNQFILKLRNDTSTTVFASFSFGSAGDDAVVGDWDGNGTETPGVRRGYDWYLKKSNDSSADLSPQMPAWGLACDRPTSARLARGAAARPAIASGRQWFIHDGPSFEYPRPVVLTDEARLTLARTRVTARTEPYYSAYVQVKASANKVLSTPPYQGIVYLDYFNRGREHAFVARDAGLVYRIEGIAASGDKARSILLDWARDPNIAAEVASETDRVGGSPDSGLVIARVMVTFAQAYALVYDRFTAQERQDIENWMRQMEADIRLCEARWPANDYYGQQYFNNHLPAFSMGHLAIGLALGDPEIVHSVLFDTSNPHQYARLLSGAVLPARRDDLLYRNDPTRTSAWPQAQAGEIYDRYRAKEGKGLHYTSLSPRMFTLMAEMARMSQYAKSLYALRGSNGLGLDHVYDFYSEFYYTRSAASRGGYYKDDHSFSPNDAVLYEFAQREYPADPDITRVLPKWGRLYNDGETFGYSAVLVHGN